MAKRNMSSILAEAVLCKLLGWRLDFVTGGFGVYSINELIEITKNISKIFNEKIWLNYGVFNKVQLEKLRPYVKGICSSIETVNPRVQKEVVPGKDIKAYIDTLKKANGFEKSLTIIIGIGETIEDVELLHELINELNLDRLTIFALHPIKGTPFTKGPSPEYYAEWIARTRIKFPKLEIVAGIPSNMPNDFGIALKAGANSITKFPVIKAFGSEKACNIVKQAREAGREFKGSITELPEINWDREIDKLEIDNDLKEKIRIKLKDYLKVMNKSEKLLYC